MTELENQRRRALSNLIQLNGPLAELSRAIAPFPSDADEALVILKRNDILGVWAKLSDHLIDDQELEEWANLLEVREDIEFEKLHSDVIQEFIFAAANPALYGESWKNELKRNVIRLTQKS